MHKPNCISCKFSEQVRSNPTDIKTVTVCKHSPPQLLTMPAQDAMGRTGVAVVAQWPQVGADAWCYQHSLRTQILGDMVPDIDLN